VIRDVVSAHKAKNPAPYREFNEVLAKVLVKYGMTFNTFAKVAASLGVEMTFNRLRDVYYERVIIMENDILAPGQRREQGGIGGEAGGKIQRGLPPDAPKPWTGLEAPR
jgi:hypothetical protein